MTAGNGIADYDFRRCKLCQEPSSRPVYALPRVGTVFCCQRCGLHYLNHLDDVSALAGAPLTDEAIVRHFAYVDSVLHSSAERFALKVDLVTKHGPTQGTRCLDVGAGGGLFMNLLQREGAEVHGIEPEPMNRQFAFERYGLRLRTELIDNPYWRSEEGRFDIVTMWDVLEHVNFPRDTLRAATRLVRAGGILCLDTPARDAFLYRMGEMTYRLTGGRSASLLATQYSRQPFGHKQIFASSGLQDLLQSLGLRIVCFKRVHELSFPYQVYLRKLLRSGPAARLASPLARGFFSFFPVRNKLVVVARKVDGDKIVGNR